MWHEYPIWVDHIYYDIIHSNASKGIYNPISMYDRNKNLILNSKTEQEQALRKQRWVSKRTKQSKEADAICLVVLHYSCCTYVHTPTHKHPLSTPPPPASLAAGHQQYFNVILSRDEQKVEYATLGLDRIANGSESRQKQTGGHTQSLFVAWSVEFTDSTRSVIWHLQDLC